MKKREEWDHQVSSKMDCNRKWQNILAVKSKDEELSFNQLRSISGIKGTVWVAANVEVKAFYH